MEVDARRADVNDYLSREVTDALATRMGPRPQPGSARRPVRRADGSLSVSGADIPIWRYVRPGPMMRAPANTSGPTTANVSPTPLANASNDTDPTLRSPRVPDDCPRCVEMRKLTMDAIVALKENRRHLQTIEQFALEGYESSDSQLQSLFLLQRIRAAKPGKLPGVSTLARYSLPCAFRTEVVLPPPPVNNSSSAAEYAHQLAAKFVYENHFRPRNSKKQFPADLVPGAQQPSRQQDATMQVEGVDPALPTPAVSGTSDIIMQDSASEVRFACIISYPQQVDIFPYQVQSQYPMQMSRSSS